VNYRKYFRKINEKIVGLNKIDNMLSYLDGMSYGINDKLYFMSEIEFDCVVDFGAADGLLLEKIKKINPNISTIAYDIDDKMLNIMKGKNIDFVSNNLSNIFEQIKYFNSPILVLSSVIHEIYSYSLDSSEIKLFWSMLFGSNFKYIVIRDMISMDNFKRISPTSDDINKIYNNTDKSLLSSFEGIWGSIRENYQTMLHYLLKYKYVDNWDREVNENYLPITIEELENLIPSKWSIYYKKHYILEYFKDMIYKDFKISIDNPTHIKIIIENKNYKPNNMVNESNKIDWDEFDT